ncbi:MAG: bacterial Ig-like domain-containing protein [Clostridia bacterium]|nr:bacterial Ig-like domain-containing protein [Clostridia bacterium]
MKKSKKLLSVLLAVLMAFSVMIVPVSAAIPDTVDTFDELVQPAGLSGLVEWLLKSLNNRKDAYIDTVLNFVCTYVPDINAGVPEGTDLFESTDTAKKAFYVVEYLDQMIIELNLMEKFGSTITSVLETVETVTLGALSIDLSDLDAILATIKSVNGVKGLLGGDIAALNLSALVDGNKALTRKDTGDLKIIKQLLQFLADNTGIFQKFLQGGLDLGLIHNISGLGDKVNSLSAELTPMIEDLVYEKLLGAPDESSTFAESEYQEWTMDQVLVGALYKMLTGTAPEADRKNDMNAFLNSNIYSLLTANGDKLYNKFLLSMLNEDVIPVLEDFATEHNLTKYFKSDVTFTASEFNFAGAQNGILGEFNNVLVALLNKLLAQDVLDEIKLEKGDNSKLNANLEKVIKFILPKIADVVDAAEFDFSKYDEEFVKDKELDYLAVDILKIFFPGWFKLGAEDIAVVNQMDTMGEVATMAVYYALKEFNPAMFEGGYDYVAEWDKKIFDEDGNINDLGNSYWGDIMLGMAVDAAFYGLALNGDNFSFDYKVSDIATKKNAGWGYAEFLGAVADWGIGMVKGLPAVTDHLPGKAEYGPFYEVNVLLNELIDWSFLSNCSNGSFTLDIETLVFDGILNNVYEFDIAGILGLFAVNDNAGNILNMNTAPAILSVVDRLLTALFENNHGATKNVTVAATCDEKGHTVDACTKCGLYVKNFKETAATGHATTEVSVQNASCKEGGIQRITCSKCDYVKLEKTEKTAHKSAQKTETVDGVAYLVTYCPVCGLESGRLPLNPMESVEIETLPAKLEYTLGSGEELDLTGIVFNGIFANGTDEEIDPSKIEVVTALDTSKVGEQVITLRYNGLTATFKVTVVEPAPQYMLGDVSDNGIVGTEDARLALRYSVRLEIPTEIQLLCADINGNGEVETSDARKILRAAVGLETLG